MHTKMILYKKYMKATKSGLQYSRLIVKSDRINALRKQYDAFIEEDKKRKDRNDFILDKLDKMRSFTGTLSLRSIPTSQMVKKTDPYNKYAIPIEKSSTLDRYLLPYIPTQPLPVDIAKNHIGDSTLLKEISKKFILIPKLSSPMIKDYPETQQKPVLDPDSDWKSKYDILNKLKQNANMECVGDKIHPINDKYENSIINDESFIGQNDKEKTINNYLTQASTKDHVPEKEVSDINNDHNLKHIENLDNCADSAYSMANINKVERFKPANVSSNININQELKSSATDFAPEVNQTAAVKENLRIEFEQQHISEVNATSNEPLTEPQINSTIVKPIDGPIYQDASLNINGQSYDDPVDDNEKIILSSQHQNAISMEQVEPHIIAKDCSNDNIALTAEQVTENENLEFPIEIINVNEFTPNEGVVLQDGVNINPHISNEDPSHQYEEKNETIEEHTEHNADVTGIEEFDEEQRNMFYSEQPDVNYTYDQTGNETGYAEYEQNANYQQNEEYAAYYENVQPEQTYPAEINEFEETSQPYDQSYQEQYATYDQKVYEQQENYEQQQHYEGVQDIDSNIQPETEHLQYETDIEPQGIEQQLDDEQGYTPIQDLGTVQNTNVENSPDLNALVNKELKNTEIHDSIIQENTLNN